LSAPTSALLALDVEILRKSTVTAPSYLPKPADGPPWRWAVNPWSAHAPSAICRAPASPRVRIGSTSLPSWQYAAADSVSNSDRRIPWGYL